MNPRIILLALGTDAFLVAGVLPVIAHETGVTMAPEHANVLLALNNSALYLGIAGGAAVGDLALRWFAVTHLAWVGVMSMLIALLIVALNLRRSREQKT